uniref:Venom protein n=1 Tax=Strongyloides stercoralis TaxID=6248 RepID=A0A0K0EPB2_STRER
MKYIFIIVILAITINIKTSDASDSDNNVVKKEKYCEARNCRVLCRRRGRIGLCERNIDSFLRDITNLCICIRPEDVA